MTTTTDPDKILNRIQALVDKAHGGTTDAEAKALLAKADELMVKYSMEGIALLDPKRPTSARPVTDSKPEFRVITLLDTGGNSEMDLYLRHAVSTMFRACAEHLFVRVGSMNSTEAKVVGYPVDLRFLEMYFLKLKMHMFSEMLVTVDPEKDWVEVMVGLKNMGYRWADVHDKLREHPEYPHRDEYWQRKFGVQFTSKMKKYCEEHPEVPRNKSSNPAAWRVDYVQGYTMEVRTRLQEMRAGTVRESDNLPALIANKKSVVEEAFYQEFPDQAPHPDTCECDTCHYAKCSKRSTCERTVCQRMRKPVPKGRYTYRKLNVDARRAGVGAGRRADLSDKGPIG